MQLVFSVVSLAFAASAVALPWTGKRNAKPPAFFLAGDSTTATRGGWGDGFLPLLTEGATGINYGHSGATTVSFVAAGDWSWVINSVKEHREAYHPYVTIQFGHNDQKAAANISISQFETNLANLVSDVRSAGGTPILVTSLTRRGFSGGQVVLNLAPQVNATLRVAEATRTTVIDLNKASTDYVNAIGSKNADLYNYAAGDRTHLNKPGEILFANLVGKLIEKSCVGPKVDRYINLNQTIVDALEAGQFILPTDPSTTTTA